MRGHLAAGSYAEGTFTTAKGCKTAQTQDSTVHLPTTMTNAFLFGRAKPIKSGTRKLLETKSSKQPLNPESARKRGAD